MEETYDLDAHRWMMFHRRPRFDSAQQFAAFCRLIGNSGAPCLQSLTGHMLENAKLGVQVDTSRPPASFYEPSTVYHVGWIVRLLERVAEAVGGQLVDVWVLADLHQIKQAGIADHHHVSTSQISRWVLKVRDAITDELVLEGMIDGNCERATR